MATPDGILKISCAPGDEEPTTYPQIIYHACGNGDGLHWMSWAATLQLSSGEENTLELWLR